MRIQRMFSATKVRGFRVIGQVQWIKRVFQFHIQYILSKQVMYIIISLDVHRIFYIKCALWIQNNTKFFFSACLCSPTLTNPIKISIVTDTDTHQRNTFLRIFIYPRPDVCDCALGKSSKKRLVLVRLTVRADPPSRPLTVSFTWFFLGVNLTLDYDYMCSETQEKNYLHPTASSRGITGMKRAFLGPLTMRKMGFEYQRIKFHWKKWVKIFTFAYGQGCGGWP